MADLDEFDALLEEPFGEDIDWTAIDGMTAATASAGAGVRSEDSEYFSNDEGVDDAFLDEVQRLEERAMASLQGGGNAAGRQSVPRAPPAAGPSRPPQSQKAKKSTCRTDFSGLEQECNLSSTPVTPGKRPRPQSCSPDLVSPTKRRKMKTREAKSQVLETFESALECPICFDIIAAAHSLSCGHSACGMCLHKWLHHSGRKTTCFSCRARHKHSLIPNFAVDAMVALYFDERLKNAEVSGGSYAAEDKIRWERRRAEGKVVVQEAAESATNSKKPTDPDPEYIPSDPFEEVVEIDFIMPHLRRRGR